MKILLISLLLFVYCFAGANWAVIVAGSNGYGNYRHQSDVSHMHQLLLQHGFDARHIIDMQYDDIADNPQNPRRGILINKPDGPNVYPGHHAIDYKGSSVTPQNFLNILSGKKTPQTPKVVESSNQDNIFVFYSDHGGPGILAMPSGGYIYATDLVRTLKEMHQQGRFHQMTIYIEACHAGSMLEGQLPPNVNIYGTTAANAHESSYAYYCGYLGTCLGDEYSVHFMEDLDQADYNSWTLQQQYIKIRDETRMSHVMQYGDVKAIPPQPVKNFVAFGQFANSKSSSSQEGQRIAQPDVPLMMKWRAVLDAPQDSEDLAISEFAKEMQMRQTADKRIAAFAAALHTTPAKLTTYERNADNFEAFKVLIPIYERVCGKLNDYTQAPHAIALTNALNSGLTLSAIEKILENIC